MAPPPNTHGNTVRGVLYSPCLITWDVSFIKRTQFKERYAGTFQLDGVREATFNLTNTPYFGFPNASIGSPTVGQITANNSGNRDL